MDYAFVASANGQKVILHFKNRHDDIEFATHLHPWVNPPLTENNEVNDRDSYPGNLPKSIELEKLSQLTDLITKTCDIKPTSYLAGRYGTGEHTLEILNILGYQTDISISPYSDFSHQNGPDFSQYNNECFVQNNILHWPHTTAIRALFKPVENWFHQKPNRFERYQKNLLTKLCVKLLRVKRQRLSPEGFSLNDLKAITKTQLSLGQRSFILSFHSPSVQSGLTPYVDNAEQESHFLNTCVNYIEWFKENELGQFSLIRENKIEVKK
jgi:hypothetical protein